jgi:hypothetical protein
MNAVVDSGVLDILMHVCNGVKRSLFRIHIIHCVYGEVELREREEKFGKDWTFRCSEYCFTTQSTHNYLMRWQLTHGSPLLQKYGTLIGHCGKGAMLRRRSFDDDGETEDGKG